MSVITLTSEYESPVFPEELFKAANESPVVPEELFKAATSEYLTKDDFLPVGWTLTTGTDQKMEEIGKFAVNEHNKRTHSNLLFECVIKGVKKGWFYSLVIQAKDGKVSNMYGAIVLDVPSKKFRKLVAFKKIVK